MRFSHYNPYVNLVGPESYFDPSLFDPSKAMRIYRPVCVGASTCNSGAATYRAIDPLTTGTPTLANTQPGFLVGKLIPNSGSFTNGLGLTTNGYPAGGIDHHFLLPQPRLGFAWDVTGNHKTIVRGGFGIAYDRYRSDVTGNAAQNQPFVAESDPELRLSAGHPVWRKRRPVAFGDYRYGQGRRLAGSLQLQHGRAA